MEYNRLDVKESGTRLDVFLSELIPELSRNKASEYVKKFGVRIKDKIIKKPSYQLDHGNTMNLSGEDIKGFILANENKRKLDTFGASGDGEFIKPENIKLDIIYEDRDILVIDKPIGLVVHPGVGNYSGTLVNGLKSYFMSKGIEVPTRIGLVHRLDKDVAGLMVIAKNNIALRSLSEQFSHKYPRFSAEKYYWAVVLTTDLIKTRIKDHKLHKIEGYISRDIKHRTKFRFNQFDDGSGRYSLSYIKVVKIGKKYSLLEVKIETGRTHQIRLHLSYLGIPVVGDTLYGGKQYSSPGIGLRCVELKFIHPRVYKRLSNRTFQSLYLSNNKAISLPRVTFSNRISPLEFVI